MILEQPAEGACPQQNEKLVCVWHPMELVGDPRPRTRSREALLNNMKKKTPAPSTHWDLHVRESTAIPQITDEPLRGASL